MPLRPEERLFDWVDYTVFGAMLVLSVLIGVYFAILAKDKQASSAEYLMGGRTMGIFPISMSLIASYISGISLLGIPAEMYVYGTQYWAIVFSDCFVSVTMIYVYLPVFFKLKITSSYEYLNMRFNKAVCIMGSGIFLLKMMLYIPMVIYVPALAFSQVTGVNLHLITPLVSIVCIFYTTVGGLKAVVWTDTLQTILMLAGVVVVLVMGTWHLGGPGVVWERNRLSGRLEFLNTDLDITTRHTLWTMLFGNYFYWLAACSVNQAMVQRCLAMPTLRKANYTVLILAVGIMGLVSMCCYTGLVLFAYFHDCDPVSTKMIGKSDQLLPYFVMEIAGAVPGFPGVFMSGVFSAALSSMSTGLNSMCGVIYTDFVTPCLRRPISEARASWIMKGIVLTIGVLCVAMVFLVEQLGAIIQGALAGGLASIVFLAWLSVGTQRAVARGVITFPQKPVYTYGCPEDILNRTIAFVTHPRVLEEPLAVYRVSYMWYSVIGTTITLVVGMLVSWATGFTDPATVDRDLLTPVIHRFLPDPAKRQAKSHMQLEKKS
ncbi:sodium-coupled monocarboxylate transporter 2-like isoform X2 [Macrosteles quadrilineatus]|uniref:sodium-coupled monocarboxylate transporter 2-like isoform X2 n=1 Tax=Macrosteles quadrilineatus TaxID=74068 RepID=UPI0023E14DCE|nr:sodium-coupled monocarboxylate transporter 2-like isoform X2 [Macrosteles quadrilineatus]